MKLLRGRVELHTVAVQAVEANQHRDKKTNLVCPSGIFTLGSQYCLWSLPIPPPRLGSLGL
jgi:hypothetical protein